MYHPNKTQSLRARAVAMVFAVVTGYAGLAHADDVSSSASKTQECDTGLAERLRSSVVYLHTLDKFAPIPASKDEYNKWGKKLEDLVGCQDEAGQELNILWRAYQETYDITALHTFLLKVSLLKPDWLKTHYDDEYVSSVVRIILERVANQLSKILEEKELTQAEFVEKVFGEIPQNFEKLRPLLFQRDLLLIPEDGRRLSILEDKIDEILLEGAQKALGINLNSPSDDVSAGVVKVRYWSASASDDARNFANCHPVFV